MTTRGSKLDRRRLAATAAIGVIAAVTGGGAAWAQAPIQTAPADGPAAATPSGSPSENLTVNLMRLLVKRGVIDQASADQLITEAERETAEARASGTANTSVAVAAPASADAQTASLPPPSPGAVRIPYIPQVVRDQIKAEVIQQAKEERWALPNAIPEWTQRVVISGDVRMRYESDLYSKNNQPDLINFAALNANGPVDVNPQTNPAGVPILNTLQNREGQLYVRARLNVEANPSDWVTGAIRLASGTTNTPVSTSQLLGGGLTKKDFWLDRAYIDIHPLPNLGATFGRMPNPFFSTDLLYDTDLNFDGAALHGAYDAFPNQGVSLFGTAGVFLTGYQDVNFPTTATSDQKSKTNAKWMFGSQVGAIWKTAAFTWKTGLAYYSFKSNQGQLSQPCALYTGITQCSTDWTVPGFMQKGNTLFLIRDIVTDVAPGSTPLPQYAGLVFPFHELNVTSTLDIPAFGKHLELTGDYVRNLAYKFSDACRYGELGLPVNNVISAPIGAPNAGDTDVCAGETGPDAPRFHSGPNAFMLRASYGDRDPNRFGEWNVTVGYKHLAPDSMLDAYTDADFHLGGTNAKGFFLLGTIGLWRGANLQARWFSADEVYGPPLSIDVGQVDLNVRF